MQFSLKIDEDIINFMKIDIDENTQRPVLEHENIIFDTLILGASVVDITGINYTPQENSIWDGTNFIDSENREVRPLSEKATGMKVFAFIVDSVYKFYYAIHDNEQNAMIVSALSSDPKIIVRP